MVSVILVRHIPNRRRLRILMSLLTILPLVSTSPASTAESSETNRVTTFASLVELIPSVSMEIFETHRYDAARSHFIFRAAPRGASPTLPVVMIHGGCWSNAYGVDHALPMAQALAQLGYDVWAAEYRRVGDAGGGWPGTLTDVKRAIDYVSQNTGIAPLVIGHSAGGHLALKASEDPNLNIRAVVALAPIIDLVTYGKDEGSCQSMVAKLMGDDSHTPDTRYQEASVARSKLRVPVKIIIGSEDPIVRFDQVAPFAPSHVSIVSGAGHFDLIHPQTIAFSRITSAIEVLSSNDGGKDR